MTTTRKAFFSFVFLFLLAVIVILPTRLVSAQDTQSGAITLTIEAGFDGAYRDQQWMPIRVRVRNEGAAVSGRLVVRPETSGSALLSTYSTPITLPEGAAQTAVFAITLRGTATQLRIELIDDRGLVVASAPALIRPIQAYDRLYVVISESPSGYVDLTPARIGGFAAFQASWIPADLPDHTAILDSVNAILIHEADTGTFTTAQRDALADWTAAGGHLIVTGGSGWQATAAGLGELLPFTPQETGSIDSLQALGDWVRIDAAAMDNAATIAVGEVRPGATVLAAGADGTPILIRGAFGSGTVDYVTVDPNSAPLRGWSGLSDLWFALITSTAPPTGWSMGITDWDQAINAAQIFPGLDALPDILPLCGFLLGYIALIGPINYIVLNRINRREWAWVTIPAFIVVFTVLAFAVGANLRGSEATINQLAFVRGWSDTERARTDTVLGVLSPRRERYSLLAPAGETLRPIPRTVTGTALLANVANSFAGIDIQQRDIFEAADFTVDASFIAPFALTGSTTAPPISGSVTFTYDDRIEGQMIVLGSVRNESDYALVDPVILARGTAEHLETTLAPGEQVTFALVLAGEGIAAPGVRVPSPALTFYSRLASQYTQTEQSVIDIMGTENFSANYYARTFTNFDDPMLDQRRRQFFMSSFVDDAFSSGRGDRVFVAGWSVQPQTTIELEGAAWSAQYSTLYVIELEAAYDLPADEVTIPPERFSWIVRDQNRAGAAPNDIDFVSGEFAEFQFTPFPTAVLSDVTAMSIRIGENSSGSRTIPLEIWNFDSAAWESILVTGGQWIAADPAPYLGAQNAVRVRATADQIASGFMRFTALGIEQRGTF